MLVAAAYARNGWSVKFRPVAKGIAKSHDLDVERGTSRYAIECKRMESGEYAEGERMRMRELFKRPCNFLVGQESSAIFDLRFKAELKDVPDDYLMKKTQDFIYEKLNPMQWDDAVASGTLKPLDLGPICEMLSTNSILYPSPQFIKLLTGAYRRYDSNIQAVRLKFDQSARLIDDVDLAVFARYECTSDVAIEKKARDILGNLAKANDQLPKGIPAAIHIGFECLYGDEVEQRRHQKIVDRVRSFDPEESGLEFVYCHYFAPDVSPTETWAFDETTHWNGNRPSSRPLSEYTMLVTPEDSETLRHGTHWDGNATKSE
jgi:hypothetical protein